MKKLNPAAVSPKFLPLKFRQAASDTRLSEAAPVSREPEPDGCLSKEKSQPGEELAGTPPRLAKIKAPRSMSAAHSICPGKFFTIYDLRIFGESYLLKSAVGLGLAFIVRVSPLTKFQLAGAKYTSGLILINLLGTQPRPLCIVRFGR